MDIYEHCKYLHYVSSSEYVTVSSYICMSKVNTISTVMHVKHTALCTTSSTVSIAHV